MSSLLYKSLFRFSLKIKAHFASKCTKILFKFINIVLLKIYSCLMCCHKLNFWWSRTVSECGSAAHCIFAQSYIVQCTMSLVKLNTTHFNQLKKFFIGNLIFKNMDPEPEHIDAAPQPKIRILSIIILLWLYLFCNISNPLAYIDDLLCGAGP
jgi:hypothetical protein